MPSATTVAGTRNRRTGSAVAAAAAGTAGTAGTAGSAGRVASADRIEDRYMCLLRDRPAPGGAPAGDWGGSGVAASQAYSGERRVTVDQHVVGTCLHVADRARLVVAVEVRPAVVRRGGRGGAELHVQVRVTAAAAHHELQVARPGRDAHREL